MAQNPNQNGNQRPARRPGRNITGPQSALTDFLASHNISAVRIREDAEQRRQAAARSQQADAEANGETTTPSAPIQAAAPAGHQEGLGIEEQEKVTKRKKHEKRTIEKIKASKTFQKRKRGNPLDSDEEDDLAQAIFDESHAPLPGQMENCAICEKRFTVTPYSVAGPEGGLLCATCGREMAKEKQGLPKKKPRKQTGGIGSRRAVQSRILDGFVGPKSLGALCIQTLAKNVDLADSLGDLPDHLVDKIARMFSKQRLLKPETLPLFAQPSTETLRIYDGARLSSQDIINIFQVATNLKRLKIRCAIQFKDEVMDYLLSRNINLELFSIHGANLLSEDKWHEFFAAKGRALEGLQVYYTDRHFGDDSVVALKTHCPNLRRLKIEHNQKVTNKGIEALGELPALEHLSLQILNTMSSAAITTAIERVGSNLKTLSLKIVPECDDSVLREIHDHCRALTKLRITDSETMTDKGFVKLFTGWQNPPLHFMDLQKCRQLDSTHPRDNVDNIGLCSEGFKALMAHSGERLEQLNIHACRHISREAFEEVFNETAVYAELRKLEISFCEEVTDFVLGCIFRSCPNIREVNVFGCMKVKDVRVPRHVILVGVPNAQGMMTEGVE